MDYRQIKMSKQTKKISNLFTRSLTLTLGTVPQAVPIPAWGIDPGVHFGLTVIEGLKVFMFHGSLVSDPTPGRQGLIAYKFMQSIIGRFLTPTDVIPTVVIEGAAYGMPFRQVELSEIRTAFYLAAVIWGYEATIKPPTTIRKSVFGNGKTQAGDEWPLINHNAADSLSMAIYASQQKGA